MNFIPVCEPLLNGNEKKYVADCMDTAWISSSGKYVKAFEEKFAQYCDVKYAVGVCNGTQAIHLALRALGVGKGDEVIIPNFTMIATAFAVCYTRAMPVFVDAEAETWNIDVEKIEEKITNKTKVILPVSIFGHPCEFDKIHELARKYNLKILEDAAESHGSEYKGMKTGSLADITAFSFFANKNITTGEGGMIVTDDEDLYDKCRYYKNLCFPLEGGRTYKHNDIGYNYRISNIHSAIGLAQVEKADEYRAMRINNANIYRRELADIEGISMQNTKDDVLHVHWMNGILINPEKYGRTRDELIQHLKDNGIDTRLLFLGMNKQPSLLKYGCDCTNEYSVSDNLHENGLYLPSSSGLDETTIIKICEVIRAYSTL